MKGEVWVVRTDAEGGKDDEGSNGEESPMYNGKGHWVGLQIPALGLAPPLPVGSVTLNKSLHLKKSLLHLKK